MHFYNQVCDCMLWCDILEELTVNQLVVGSIPTAGAIFQNVNSTVKRVLNAILLYNKSYKEL